MFDKWKERIEQSQLDEGESRKRQGLTTSLVGLLANTILALSKIIIGNLTGVLSITADGMNNLSDGIANLISLSSFVISARPSDEGHPFGHARFEYIASSLISLLILFLGFQLLREAAEKILHPTMVEVRPVQIVVLVMSMALKFWMQSFYSRRGKALNSSVLMATAQDSANDVIMTGGILLSLILSHFFRLSLDGPIAIVIAILIAKAGLEILSQNYDRLMGEEADSELVKKIEDRILESPEVIEIHNLKIHDYGPGQSYVTCDIMVDARLSLLRAHGEADAIEKSLAREGIDITIHIDPMIVDNPAINEAREKVRKLVEGSHRGCHVYDLQIIPASGTGPDGLPTPTSGGEDLHKEPLKISFGLAVAYSVKDEDDQLLEEMEAMIAVLYPHAEVDIQIERTASPSIDVTRPEDRHREESHRQE